MHAAAAFEEESEFTKSPEGASANRPGCSPGYWNAHKIEALQGRNIFTAPQLESCAKWHDILAHHVR
jgi:hypothetical protein